MRLPNLLIGKVLVEKNKAGIQGERRKNEPFLAFGKVVGLPLGYRFSIKPTSFFYHRGVQPGWRFRRSFWMLVQN